MSRGNDSIDIIPFLLINIFITKLLERAPSLNGLGALSFWAILKEYETKYILQNATVDK